MVSIQSALWASQKPHLIDLASSDDAFEGYLKVQKFGENPSSESKEGEIPIGLKVSTVYPLDTVGVS